MSSRSFIRVLDAQVYAHHGVTDHERSLGGRYAFDLELETDITPAAASDDLNETVDYERAYRTAMEIMTGENRHLLESLVVRIADALLLRFPSAISVTVRLRKLSVPINGIVGAVEVEYYKVRGER